MRMPWLSSGAGIGSGGRGWWRRCAVATPATLVAAAVGWVAPVGAQAATPAVVGAPPSASFQVAGDRTLDWVVPDRVHAIDVTVVGASGRGQSDTGLELYGFGAKLTGRVAVTPGETLRLYGATAGGWGVAGTGYIAGGRGAGAGQNGGGGGGAAAVVRRRPTGDVPLVVAGGGGGRGGDSSTGCGDGAGGAAGTNGGRGSDGDPVPPCAGVVSALGGAASGVQGAGNPGGAGGEGASQLAGGGGGGGGGWPQSGLGGEGGMCATGGTKCSGGGGGGAGGSYVDAAVTGATVGTSVYGGSGGVEVKYTQLYDTSVVVSGPSTVTYGQPVDVAVTVSSQAGQTHPAGTVSVTGAAASVTAQQVDTSGKANFANVPVAVGTNTLTFTFTPDSPWYEPSSGKATVGVQKAGTSITDLGSTVVVPGSPVQVWGRVAPVPPEGAGTMPVPTGRVSWPDGAGGQSSAVLDGEGNFSATIPWSLGKHTVTITYSGDGNYGASSTGADSPVIDMEKTPSAFLDVTSTTPQWGEPVTVSGWLVTSQTLAKPVAAPRAQGQWPVPTGTVKISDGATWSTTATVDQDGYFEAELPWTHGTHKVKFSYAGDDLFLPAADVTVTVTMTRATPSVSLTATPTTVMPGSPVTTTVTVTAPPLDPPELLTSRGALAAQAALSVGPTPTGTVQIAVDGTLVGRPVPVDADGQASIPVTDLVPGVRNLTAVYSGDDLYAGATSGAVAITVTAPPAPPAPPRAPGPNSLAYTGVQGSTLTLTGFLAALAILLGVGLIVAAERRARHTG